MNTQDVDWEVFVERKDVPLLFVDMFFSSLYPQDRVHRLTGFRVQFRRLLRTASAYYYTAPDREASYSFFREICRADRAGLDRSISLVGNRLTELRAILKAQKLRAGPDLPTSWKTFNNHVATAFCYLMLKHQLGTAAEDHVDELLRDEGVDPERSLALKAALPGTRLRAMEDVLRVGLAKLWRALEALCEDERIMDSFLDDRELTQLVISLRDSRAGKRTYSLLCRLCAQFGWKKSTYWDMSSYTGEDLIRLARKQAQEGPSHSLARAHSQATPPSELSRYWLKLLARLQALHTLDVELLFWAGMAASPLLAAVSSDLKLRREELMNLTFSEITGALRSRSQGSQDLRSLALKRREEGWTLVYHDGVPMVEGGDKLPATQKTVSSRAELVGRPAYPGQLQGWALVARSPDDLRRLLSQRQRRPLILVTTATTVDWEVVIAGGEIDALATQEGGITSHAAKVARESQLPCVVGIGGLMETIHTGDHIDLDANKGVLRQISSETRPSDRGVK